MIADALDTLAATTPQERLIAEFCDPQRWDCPRGAYLRDFPANRYYFKITSLWPSQEAVHAAIQDQPAITTGVVKHFEGQYYSCDPDALPRHSDDPLIAALIRKHREFSSEEVSSLRVARSALADLRHWKWSASGCDARCGIAVQPNTYYIELDVTDLAFPRKITVRLGKLQVMKAGRVQLLGIRGGRVVYTTRPQM